MFPRIPLVSGSGLLAGPGYFSSNSSTFLKTGEIPISPEKETDDQMCIKAARKRQARTGIRKMKSWLLKNSMDLLRTSSSFDGNVLKILHELSTLH